MKPEVDPGDIGRFRELVRARTGIAPGESRAADLARAVRRTAAELRVADSGALYELVARDRGEGDPLDALLSALNVSETHFFRDAGQMRALEHRILPDLIARRRRERRLRVWSAACSTGEEAYTLAILIRRLLPEHSGWDVLVLATDINGRSLDRARQGRYRPWSLRGLSPAALSPFLTAAGDHYEVAPSIRSMVTFAQLNLVDDVYPSTATNTQAMDLILCRNVVMYFSDAGRRRAIGRLGEALAEDGYLLTSQVEAGLGRFAGLTLEAPGTAVFRKGRQEEPAPPDGEAAPPPPEQPAVRKLTLSASPRRRARPVASAPAGDAHAIQEEALRRWRTGGADAALQTLDEAIERTPLVASLHYFRGMMLLDADQPDAALAAFRRCTYADPECAVGHLALATMLARQGREGRARAALRTAERLVEPLEPDATFFAGQGPSAGAVRELIAAQHHLLDRPTAEGGHD